ncbi:hypothetical protein O181_089243 [Austropuccinia psidii MF-1]|uniref:Nudix hydrolase domain-containing protein n=1 Tax=Austropuccinia psidii MF-1 TaxID=1389203 RepID=A0A9Q3P4C6_9BASI|nr:hypothetical protein [Austropuccinia psidii MF-1]
MNLNLLCPASLKSAHRHSSLDLILPLTGLDLAKIRLILASLPKRPPFILQSPPYSPYHAAVLIGLCNRETEGPAIILTVRSPTLRAHPGEICFPGGRHDQKTDLSLLSTALRETHEEVGLKPDQIEYLGSLQPVYNSSRSTLVWPFVAFIYPRQTTSLSPCLHPVIPRLMSKLDTTPLPSFRLEELCGKYHKEEVVQILQVGFSTLLRPDKQIPAFFRGNSQKPYLEWDMADGTPGLNESGDTEGGMRSEGKTRSLRLWGLSGWFVNSFLWILEAL